MDLIIFGFWITAYKIWTAVTSLISHISYQLLLWITYSSFVIPLITGMLSVSLRTVLSNNLKERNISTITLICSLHRQDIDLQIFAYSLGSCALFSIPLRKFCEFIGISSSFRPAISARLSENPFRCSGYICRIHVISRLYRASFLYTNPLDASDLPWYILNMNCKLHITFHIMGSGLYQELGYFLLSYKRSSLRELLMQYHFHIEDDVPVEFPLDCPPSLVFN